MWLCFHIVACFVISGSGCKLEVGVSSCLLTPSASPGAAEERGMNEGMWVQYKQHRRVRERALFEKRVFQRPSSRITRNESQWKKWETSQVIVKNEKWRQSLVLSHDVDFSMCFVKTEFTMKYDIIREILPHIQSCLWKQNWLSSCLFCAWSEADLWSWRRVVWIRLIGR